LGEWVSTSAVPFGGAALMLLMRVSQVDAVCQKGRIRVFRFSFSQSHRPPIKVAPQGGIRFDWLSVPLTSTNNVGTGGTDDPPFGCAGSLTGETSWKVKPLIVDDRRNAPAGGLS
jgi:hypothetical protein